MQVQIIDARFQRDDPSIEEIARRHALAPEVVDDEDAAVRFQMNGRFVELRQVAVSEVEHFERQLAADRDDRPADSHPAAIDRVVAIG